MACEQHIHGCSNPQARGVNPARIAAEQHTTSSRARHHATAGNETGINPAYSRTDSRWQRRSPPPLLGSPFATRTSRTHPQAHEHTQSRTSTRSSVQRPIGPAVQGTVFCPSTPPSFGSMTPLFDRRPAVGLKPYTPQKWAGMRMLPPMSVPTPRGVQRAAISAPSPPLLPPGVRPA